MSSHPFEVFHNCFIVDEMILLFLLCEIHRTCEHSPFMLCSSCCFRLFTCVLYKGNLQEPCDGSLPSESRYRNRTASTETYKRLGESTSIVWGTLGTTCSNKGPFCHV